MCFILSGAMKQSASDRCHTRKRQFTLGQLWSNCRPSEDGRAACLPKEDVLLHHGSQRAEGGPDPMNEMTDACSCLGVERLGVGHSCLQPNRKKAQRSDTGARTNRQCPGGIQQTKPETCPDAPVFCVPTTSLYSNEENIK